MAKVRSKIGEMRNMTAEDLRIECEKQRVVIAKLRIQVTMDREKNSSKYVAAKRDLSRMLTVLNEKRRKEQEEAKAAPSTPLTPAA